MQNRPPLARAHVLAVDDDPSIRQLIANCLGDHDLRVSTVDSGQAMAELMARESVDLVLLDLRLPGEDRLELARRLRETSKLPTSS
jgi:two-component system OmpR family response regulator